MLLEEIILRLLEVAGYQTIFSPDGDLISSGSAGLELQGRACKHQIDAVADYQIQPPFSHPQRLLVEAKCYATPIELEVVRNALAVHKDLSELWRFPEGHRQRYHYQYAIFSATPFSSNAEAFAFAHDIYLFPLGHSHFIRPVLQAIWKARTRSLESIRKKAGLSLRELRTAVRASLRGASGGRNNLSKLLRPFGAEHAFKAVLDEAAKLEGVLFATTRSGLLLLLVPAREIENLSYFLRSQPEHFVRIRIDRRRGARGWYIEDQNGRRLFTLDIPPTVFRLHIENDSRRLLDAKRALLSEIQVPYIADGQVGFTRLRLDMEWISYVLRNLREQ